jgi:hypothetical protein
VKELAAILTKLCIASDECSYVDRGARPKSKRSLDFSSPKAPPLTAPAVQVMDDVELQLSEVRIVLEVFQLVCQVLESNKSHPSWLQVLPKPLSTNNDVSLT